MSAYDEGSLRPFHARLAVACFGGVFADGFGLGIIGISLTGAAAALGLDAAWLGALGAASLAGLFAGAVLCGPAADRFGRRPVFCSNMPLAAVLSGLQFWVASGSQLLLLRLAIGFLLGTDYVVSKALLSEFAPRRHRGRVLGSLSVAWAGGYAAAYATGFRLAPVGPGGWRWMLLASAIPCLLVAPLRLTIPESPLWSMRHGQRERAARIVARTLGPDVQLPERVGDCGAGHGRWPQLFSARWRVRTLVACCFFACQVIPYFAVGTFVYQVMAALGLRGAYFGGLIYNFALLLGAIAGLLIVDRISRRSFLVASFAAAGLAMLVLSANAGIGAQATVILFGIFAGVLSAASNLVYVYLPELFPTNLRASGIGLAVAASRIGSAIGTFLLPLVVVDFGARTALGACVAILAIGALVCYCWAPETRNLSLASLDQPAR
jgi:MFS transporter, putative metabolite transport protein